MGPMSSRESHLEVHDEDGGLHIKSRGCGSVHHEPVSSVATIDALYCGGVLRGVAGCCGVLRGWSWLAGDDGP
jgi:hypothetical protein